MSIIYQLEFVIEVLVHANQFALLAFILISLMVCVDHKVLNNTAKLR